MKNNFFFNYLIGNIYSKPSSVSEVSSQILYGEKFSIISKNKRWIKIKTNYEKAVNQIKLAKKFEKKGKEKKAKKIYEKAQKLLIKSNTKNPNNADTLNYLGFTTRKLGDYNGGEKYYLQGLALDPSHVGINEYLGELYVVTNRINLANERLEVLAKCNCEEYSVLKMIIDGK